RLAGPACLGAAPATGGSPACLALDFAGFLRAGCRVDPRLSAVLSRTGRGVQRARTAQPAPGWQCGAVGVAGGYFTTACAGALWAAQRRQAALAVVEPARGCGRRRLPGAGGLLAEACVQSTGSRLADHRWPPRLQPGGEHVPA